jgi:hypothetical protein
LQSAIYLGYTGIVCDTLARYSKNLLDKLDLTRTGYTYMAALWQKWDILTILVLEGFACDTEPCLSAAEQGQLQLLQFLRAHGAPWNYLVTNRASKNNHIEVLKWAIQNGASYNGDVYANIAFNGDLETLKQMHQEHPNDEMRLAWVPLAYNQAAFGGHLDILEWLRQTFGPIWDDHIYLFAAHSNQVKILEWLIRSSPVIPNYTQLSSQISWHAAVTGSLDSLKWLRSHGVPMDIQDCIRFTKYENVIEWLQSLRP